MIFYRIMLEFLIASAEKYDLIKRENKILNS